MPDRVEQRVGAPPTLADALPRGEEPGERLVVDGLHLAAQPGERAPPEPAQHLDVAPLPLEAVGAELADDDAAERLEPVEGPPDRIDREPEPLGGLDDAEGTVGPGVPGHEIGHRVGHRLREGAGEATRRGGAKRIAEPRCVLGCGHPGLPGDPDPDRPVFGQQ